MPKLIDWGRKETLAKVLICIHIAALKISTSLNIKDNINGTCMHTILILLSIPIIRFLININDWYFFKTLINKQQTYLAGVSDDSTDEEKIKSGEAASWIMNNITELKRRVEKAGITKPVKPYMQPSGYGYVGQQNLPILDNILFLNPEVQHTACHVVKTAKGHYLNHALRSLSPLYWLEVIFYLPKEIASATGIAGTSKVAETVINIIQIIYWMALITAILIKPDMVKPILSLKP